MPAAPVYSDHVLRCAVLDEIEATQGLSTDRVGVSAAEGAVILSGEVLDYPEKLSVMAAAHRVRGVIAVVDDITVRHEWGHRSDTAVAREVGAALATSILLGEQQITASVRRGIVTLRGTVDWAHQRLGAERAVEHLPGVSRVRNCLDVAEPSGLTAQSAKQKVAAALVRHAELEADDIQVAVDDAGCVTLAGAVASWAERSEAESAAWFSPGVSHVDNQLSVTG